jgi:hypothetical protein
MLDQNYLDSLRIIVRRLEDTAIDWVVTGSCGFALQGVDVAVHDIDLQTDKDGAYAIERLFLEESSRKVVYSIADNIRSHLGALAINGIQVEIMGDIQKRLNDGIWEEPVDIRSHRRWVTIDGMHIPVLSLEHEYKAYLALGRVEKAEMLRKWLQSKDRHANHRSRSK